MSNTLSRRDVLKWTAAGSLAAAMPAIADSGRQDKKKIGLGVQLYSFRDMKDIDSP